MTPKILEYLKNNKVINIAVFNSLLQQELSKTQSVEEVDKNEAEATPVSETIADAMKN